MRITVGLAVIGALVAAGCSSGTAPAAAPASPGASVAVPTAASVPAPTSAAAPLDAAGLLAKLKAAGLPIGTTGVTTAANDGNHLLGRPNGYSSKVYWVDTRVDQSKVHKTSVDDLMQGGSIETYPDVAGATTRRDYIAAIAKSAPVLANEYDYLAGTSLVRVSGLLTPDQAKQYEAAA